MPPRNTGASSSASAAPKQQPLDEFITTSRVAAETQLLRALDEDTKPKVLQVLREAQQRVGANFEAVTDDIVHIQDSGEELQVRVQKRHAGLKSKIASYRERLEMFRVEFERGNAEMKVKKRERVEQMYADVSHILEDLMQPATKVPAGS